MICFLFDILNDLFLLVIEYLFILTNQESLFIHSQKKNHYLLSSNLVKI
jgi:hypothetical protein